ncbi:MAG: hypothetical protein PVG39_25845 [Desulfobacteraceae bacterium]|jgi:hypothetical protein
MLFESEDKTYYTGGPLDVIRILHDVTKNTYHAAFLEEHPLPGEVKDIDEIDVIRLISKMHRTEGSLSIEEELPHLEDLASKIHLREENIWRNPIDWNGMKAENFIVGNWRR